jgi:hypothetical protein
MWIITTILVLGTGYLFGSGNWRGRPNAIWPLLVMTGAWTAVAAYELWFEFIYDPTGQFNIRADLIVFGASLMLITIICTAWIFLSPVGSPRLAQRRSR